MKVAIIGGARTRPELPIPWDDPDWQKWSCNALYTRYPTEKSNGAGSAMLLSDLGYGDEVYPFDAWFQLHTPAYMRKHWASGFASHEPWLTREHDFPVYMQKKYRNYPSSERFPRELIEELPRGRYQMFSFSWMFCFALVSGAETIGLFGCGAGPGEPLAARACMEYWIGYADGKGTRVVLSGTPTLFMSHHRAEMYGDYQYAYDDEPALELGDGWKDVR